jgi:hypothetical protein
MKCDSKRVYGLIHETRVNKPRVIRALEEFTGDNIFTALAVEVPANGRPNWARQDLLGPSLFEMVAGIAKGKPADDMLRFRNALNEKQKTNMNEAEDRLLTASRHLAERLSEDIGGDFTWSSPHGTLSSGCFALAEMSLYPVMVYACYAAAAQDYAAAERAIELIEVMRTVPVIAPKKIERGRWYVLVKEEIH